MRTYWLEISCRAFDGRQPHKETHFFLLFTTFVRARYIFVSDTIGCGLWDVAGAFVHTSREDVVRGFIWPCMVVLRNIKHFFDQRRGFMSRII